MSPFLAGLVMLLPLLSVVALALALGVAVARRLAPYLRPLLATGYPRLARVTRLEDRRRLPDRRRAAPGPHAILHP